MLTALELILLPALAWPWLRLALDPRRRLARVAPGPFAVLVAGLLAGGAAALLAARASPIALHAGAGAGAVVAVVGAWRGRRGYGRGRRLPPGSLALSRSIEALVDPGFYEAERRRHGPVFKMAQFHRPVVCVVGLELAHDLMRRHRDRLGPSLLPWNDQLRGGFLRYMDDVTHDQYGALFRVALAGPVVADAEEATRRAACRELTALALASAGGVGRRTPIPVAPGAALDRIVLAAFARVLFGIEEGTPEYTELESGYDVLRLQSLGARLAPPALHALAELRALVERRAAALTGAAATGAAESSPRCALGELARTPGMPDGVCIDNLLFILRIATDNVGALLRWLLKTLGDHPEWNERLGSSHAPDLARRIVMETLRLRQSEYLYRVVREPFEHGGFRFPAGWFLRICVRESHRDAEIWPDAGRFDPDRFAAGPPPRSRYSPFGFHQHACNGVELNDMICRVTLEELARGFDWSLAGDGDLERGFRHWSHWRPSSRLALAITARRPPGADSGGPGSR